MLVSIAHILPMTTIRRERLLPVPGKVLVRKGQKVDSADVVAEAVLSPEHIMLDIARGLGLPSRKANDYLQREVGDTVHEGDLLAGPVGFTRRVVRAPHSGTIVYADKGQVLLELDKPQYELRAGFPGLVISLVPERGVVIECSGALLQGVWGNGKADYGLLHVVLIKPGDELVASQLDVGVRGAVVFGGFCGSAEVLQLASEIPVKGLIVASLSASLVPLAMRMPFPIVVIEGFGKIPLNSVAYNLIMPLNRHEVALVAQPLNHFTNSRPEVIVPLPATSQIAEPRQTAELYPNQRVRLVNQPYKSKIGRIVSMRAGQDIFPSGVRAMSADVQLEDGEKLMVPLRNLEVLE